MPFLQTSARTAENVEAAFIRMAEELIRSKYVAVWLSGCIPVCSCGLALLTPSPVVPARPSLAPVQSDGGWCRSRHGQCEREGCEEGRVLLKSTPRQNAYETADASRSWYTLHLLPLMHARRLVHVMEMVYACAAPNRGTCRPHFPRANMYTSVAKTCAPALHYND